MIPCAKSWNARLKLVVPRIFNSLKAYRTLIPSLLLAGGLFSCTPPPAEIDGLTTPRAINPLDDRPYVLAWLDGEPIRLAADTGSTYSTLLFAEAVKNAGGTIRGKGRIKTTRLYAVLYGEPDTDTPQYVVSAPGAPAEGLVGWPILKQFVWEINFPNHEHDFSDKLPPNIQKGHTLTLSEQDGLPLILAPGGEQATLDTGAPYAVYLSDSRWKQWKKDHPDTFITHYSGYSPAAGGCYVKECARAKAFFFGGIEWNNVVVCQTFVDPKIANIDHPINIMLGLEALHQHEVIIDGPGKRLYVKPFSHANSIEKPLINLAGLSVTYNETSGDYELKVFPGSVAWRAGVRNGDKFVSLNRRKSPNLDLITYFTTQPGSKTQLVVLRRGKYRTFKWTLPTEASLQPTPPTPPPVTLPPELIPNPDGTAPDPQTPTPGSDIPPAQN